MELLVDPACPLARALQEEHRRRVALLEPGKGRLASLVTQQLLDEQNRHVETCPTCLAYTSAPKTCNLCGKPLLRENGAFVCRSWKHKWFKFLGRKPIPPKAPAAPLPSRPKLKAAATAPPAAASATVPPRPPPANTPQAVRTPKTPPEKLRTLSPPRPAATRPAPPRAPPHRPPPTANGTRPPAKKPRPASPKPREDPYAILGVPADAAFRDIQKAYREKVRQYHPDKVATMAPEFQALAEQKMRDINRAYDAIRKLHAT